MLLTDEHELIRKSLRTFIEREIEPHADAWEEERIFPAHELFKKLGNEGFLGLTKPEEYGGAGLDYSYAIVMAEELGRCSAGGIPLAIGVQTDMATPALARYGSDELRREFLAPSIAGDYVACLGVSEVGAGSDVASLAMKAGISTMMLPLGRAAISSCRSASDSTLSDTLPPSSGHTSATALSRLAAFSGEPGTSGNTVRRVAVTARLRSMTGE